jgi:hypothetical protein
MPITRENYKECRLLCAFCKTVETIAVVTDQCKLACRHVRPLGLLPKRANTVGLEDLNTPQGQRWFPAQKENICTL